MPTEAAPELAHAPRYAKWQQPLRTSLSFLRLSFERWQKEDGTLGWGTPEDPFPGADNVKIQVFEHDVGGEATGDDVIATFTGSLRLEKILPWTYREKSGRYVRSKKERESIIFVPSGPPVIPPAIQIGPVHDVVWVNFAGRDEEPFRLEIPSEDGEFEGDFFEVGFKVEFPEMDGETEFLSQATMTRTREGVLLAVEPLPQFSLTLAPNSNLHHRQILDFFHDGKKDTKSRTWGSIVFKYRDDRTPDSQNTFGNAGCSIVSYTMLTRYLRDPESTTDESIFDRRVASATLSEKSKPFKKSGTPAKFSQVNIPDHWWPARMAWFARDRANYSESLAEDSKSLTMKGGVNGYMHGTYGLIENQGKLNEAMGLTCTVHTVNSKNWEEKRDIIKATLDDGIPVVALASRGGKGGHYIVIVGYYFEEHDGERKIRFVLNDAGTSYLRTPAQGEPGSIPIEAAGEKMREVSKIRIFRPDGWDRSKHARFSPVLRRNPFQLPD